MTRCKSQPLAVALLLGAAAAQLTHAATVTVADMDAADWTRTVMTDTGDASVTTTVDVRAGEPTNTFWLTRFDKPASTGPGTSGNAFAHVFQAFAWNPAVDGAVDRFDFALDGLRVSSTFGNGAAGFVRPVVEQGGALYFVTGSALSLEALAAFTTLSWQFEDTDAWTQAGGGAGPDFTSAGGTLHFGYRWELGTSCTGVRGCTGASASAGIDNFQVTVTPLAANPPGVVPEPSLALLLCTAAGAAGWCGRHRRNARPRHAA